MMDQSVLDSAVRIATNRALAGQPVGQLVWIAPRSAAEDPRGSFIIVPCPPLTAADTPPWEGY